MHRLGKFILFAIMSFASGAWPDDGDAGLPICSSFEDSAVANGQRNLTSATFDPKGERVITSSEAGLARLWVRDPQTKTWIQKGSCQQQDVAFPRILGTIKGNTKWVRDSEFSPLGDKVISVGPFGNAWIWDAGRGDCKGQQRQVRYLFGHTEDVRTARFSPDGRWVVTTSDDATIRVWDASFRAGDPNTRRPIAMVKFGSEKFPKAFSTSAQFSPDGKYLLATNSSGKMELFSVDIGPSGFKLQNRKIWPENPNDIGISQAQFNRDSNSVVTAAEDGEIAIWDLEFNKSPPLRAALPKGTPHRGANSVGFSRDGRRIIAGLSDGTVHVYDVKDHVDLGAYRVSYRAGVKAEFSPDDKEFVASSSDGATTVCPIPSVFPRSARNANESRPATSGFGQVIDR